MKKIYRLREWLTTEEAAGHLSLVLGEEVVVADILRLALDGHLTLSVNLVNKAKARLGRVVPFKDVPLMETLLPVPGAAPGEVVRVPVGRPIDPVKELTEETPFVCFDESVVTIDGVWDLTMKGAESLDVEHEFQGLTSGPSIELVHLEGPLVCRTDGQWAQLQDKFEDREVELPDGTKKRSPGSYYPAGGLPADAHLVVKMAALTAFQAKLLQPSGSGADGDGPLGTRERETLLKILIGMAIEAYRHDPTAARSSTTAEIVSDLAKHGLSVTDDTVRKYLKEAASTVLPRQGGA